MARFEELIPEEWLEHIVTKPLDKACDNTEYREEILAARNWVSQQQSLHGFTYPVHSLALPPLQSNTCNVCLSCTQQMLYACPALSICRKITFNNKAWPFHPWVDWAQAYISPVACRSIPRVSSTYAA